MNPPPMMKYKVCVIKLKLLGNAKSWVYIRKISVRSCTNELKASNSNISNNNNSDMKQPVKMDTPKFTMSHVSTDSTPKLPLLKKIHLINSTQGNIVPFIRSKPVEKVQIVKPTLTKVNQMEINSNVPAQVEPKRSNGMVQIPLKEYIRMTTLLGELNARLAKLEERNKNAQ